MSTITNSVMFPINSTTKDADYHISYNNTYYYNTRALKPYVGYVNEGFGMYYLENVDNSSDRFRYTGTDIYVNSLNNTAITINHSYGNHYAYLSHIFAAGQTIYVSGIRYPNAYDNDIGSNLGYMEVNPLWAMNMLEDLGSYFYICKDVKLEHGEILTFKSDEKELHYKVCQSRTFEVNEQGLAETDKEIICIGRQIYKFQYAENSIDYVSRDLINDCFVFSFSKNSIAYHDKKNKIYKTEKFYYYNDYYYIEFDDDINFLTKNKNVVFKNVRGTKNYNSTISFSHARTDERANITKYVFETPRWYNYDVFYA